MNTVRKKPKAQRREVQKSQASERAEVLGQEVFSREQRNYTFLAAKRSL